MESKFDGGVLGMIGVGFVTFLLALIPLVGVPMGVCYQQRWIATHTTIEGKRLKFVGAWGDLFIKNLIWTLLTVITLGIYMFWYSINLKKWEVANTIFDPEQEVQAA